jgi:hypothetical protein
MRATARFLAGHDPGSCPSVFDAVAKLLASLGAPPPDR